MIILPQRQGLAWWLLLGDTSHKKQPVYNCIKHIWPGRLDVALWPVLGVYRDNMSSWDGNWYSCSFSPPRPTDRKEDKDKDREKDEDERRIYLYLRLLSSSIDITLHYIIDITLHYITCEIFAGHT